MKKFYGGLIGALLLCVLCGACGEPNKKLFADTGIFGRHNLHRIEKSVSFTGNISGSFFLGIGSVDGSLNTDRSLQFYWSPKPGEVVATMLPYKKFRFILDEARDIPSVEFVFTDFWLNHDSPFINTVELQRNKQNPNSLLMSKDSPLVIAVVRISKPTMEKEVYLPK
jgi:hypothetical protein